MKVAVWDTYVRKENGNVLHFDIIVPENNTDESLIFDYGKKYLTSIQTKGQITSEECQYCHIESPSNEIVSAIEQKGFYILEMEEIPKNLPQNPTRRDMILFLKAHFKDYRFANFKGVSEEEVKEKLKLKMNE
ncbi:MAG: DUF2024 family protein [Vicingus serpentipes]|nr:DUF2024 family protein [Vicingus serpentipes]